MAQFGKGVEGINAAQTVRITDYETAEKFTVYTITVTVGQYTWTVKHRYSEFYDLHEKLVQQYKKVDKRLLPPKKLFGNLTDAFIKKRQKELEIYLQTVLLHLGEVPAVLGQFLDFSKYEIHGITQALAEELYHKGDDILQAGEVFHVSPLQLFSVCQRLQLPEPTCETGDAKKDIGHILDLFTRLKCMKIIGSDDKIGTSDICPNQLSYDLNKFKSILSLHLENCNAEMITDVEGLKKTLKTLKVENSVKYLKDVLLLDVGLWHGEGSALVPAWTVLTAADFSHNNIKKIDESVKLMPRLECLDMSYNKLEDIEHLQHLSSLVQLNLSHNHMRLLESLHTKLGNIKELNLASNHLESLKGFSKLYSLVNLDVSNNEISQVLEIRHIGGLPCLENLLLTGNPVTIVLDYRTRILELFCERAAEICLDHQKPTQKEVDTVNILIAIQKSKEVKIKTKKIGKKSKPATEVNIEEQGSPALEGGRESPSNVSTGNH